MEMLKLKSYIGLEMRESASRAAVAIISPIAILMLGSWAMNVISDRNYFMDELQQTGYLRGPLNMRFQGYRLESAKEYWDALEKIGGQRAEIEFLTLDLAFPFVYGTAFSLSFLWVWSTLGKRFHLTLVFIPLAVILLADWSENIIQLAQLHRHGNLQGGWIQAASYSTMTKLWLSLGLYMVLVGCVLVLLYRNRT